jgi:hypothetical protein
VDVIGECQLWVLLRGKRRDKSDLGCFRACVVRLSMVDGRYTRWFSFTFCCWNLACLMFFSRLFPFPPYNFFLNTIFLFVFRCSVVLGHEAATTVCALEAHCTRQDLFMSAVSTVAAQPGAPHLHRRKCCSGRRSHPLPRRGDWVMHGKKTKLIPFSRGNLYQFH